MSLHHAHNHIIRTLNAHGDKVVVGSSDFTESSTGSHLRCHTISGGAEPRDWHRIDELQGPIFEITLNSILPFSERFVPRGYLGVFGIGQAVQLKFGLKKSLFFLVGLSVLFLALASDQPSRVSSVSTRGIQIPHTPNSQSTAPSRNPTLSTLLGWTAGYISSQVSEWVVWLTQMIAWMVKLVSYGGLVVVKALLFALSSLTRVIFLIPRHLKKFLGEVPDLLANFICDILRMQGFSDVCPE